MTRRLACLVAVALGAVAPGTAGAAQRLAETGNAQFPLRSFVLTPDEPLRIDVAKARVTENGRPVTDARLEPLGSVRGSSVLMLVIDASESMRGEPIRRAVEAARVLAAGRPPGQRLGVVLFDRTARVHLRPTIRPAQIDAALGEIPRLQGGTHMFDATATALREMAAARAGTGAVVLLSDGDDTGSAATLPGLAQQAKRAGARIFTVGLRSRKFDGTSLQQLARVGRGEYREAASAGDLNGIFSVLGARFAREYLLTYRSGIGPRTRVDVVLAAPGLPGAATASYVTPAGATAVVENRGFWAEDQAVGIVALGLGLLVGLASLALLAARRRRRHDVRGRIAAFGMPARADVLEGIGAADRTTVLDRYSWWEAFAEDVDIGQMTPTPERLAAAGLIGGVAAAALFMTITGSPILVVLALAGPLVVKALVSRAARAMRRAFAEQLVDTLHGAASALRAGHSISSALTEVSRDAAEPTHRELGRALNDERLGRPLDDALRNVARRMDSRDIEQIALVSHLQRATGANMAEVLDRVTETVRERQDLQRTIVSLTAQGRMARIVLTALPPAILLAVSIINPGYYEPLFNEPAGIALLCVAAAMTAAGSYAIKKIVDIEV